VQLVEPWVLKVPTAQGRQAAEEVAPMVVEYVPAAQGLQAVIRALPTTEL